MIDPHMMLLHALTQPPTITPPPAPGSEYLSRLAQHLIQIRSANAPAQDGGYSWRTRSFIHPSYGLGVDNPDLLTALSHYMGKVAG